MCILIFFINFTFIFVTTNRHNIVLLKVQKPTVIDILQYEHKREMDCVALMKKGLKVFFNLKTLDMLFGIFFSLEST